MDNLEMSVTKEDFNLYKIKIGFFEAKMERYELEKIGVDIFYASIKNLEQRQKIRSILDFFDNFTNKEIKNTISSMNANQRAIFYRMILVNEDPVLTKKVVELLPDIPKREFAKEYKKYKIAKPVLGKEIEPVIYCIISKIPDVENRNLIFERIEAIYAG